MIGNSGAARLVHSWTPAEWADALGRLMDSPEEAQDMVVRGRKLLKERFSLEAMRERYAELYRQALQRTREPAAR